VSPEGRSERAMVGELAGGAVTERERERERESTERKRNTKGSYPFN
jgi:hypothetical protein